MNYGQKSKAVTEAPLVKPSASSAAVKFARPAAGPQQAKPKQFLSAGFELRANCLFLPRITVDWPSLSLKSILRRSKIDNPLVCICLYRISVCVRACGCTVTSRQGTFVVVQFIFHRSGLCLHWSNVCGLGINLRLRRTPNLHDLLIHLQRCRPSIHEFCSPEPKSVNLWNGGVEKWHCQANSTQISASHSEPNKAELLELLIPGPLPNQMDWCVQKSGVNHDKQSKNKEGVMWRHSIFWRFHVKCSGLS